MREPRFVKTHMTMIPKLMRRPDFLIAMLVLIACIIVGNGWLPNFLRRSEHVHRMLSAQRDLSMLVYVAHPTARLRSEGWAFHDHNGYSRVRYTVVGGRGSATVTEPPSPRVDVPALFDLSKNVDLWNLATGQGESHIKLGARVNKSWRYHDVYFDTARTLGPQKREYQLDLQKQSPQQALALIQLRSTPQPSSAIVRYINEVRGFGTPAFRAACQAARNQVEDAR